jgi:hypothetical protein
MGPPTKVDFLGGFNCLSKELGFSCPYHASKVLLDSCLFLLEAISMSNLGPFPLKNFSLLGLQHVCPLLNNSLKDVHMVFRKIFLKIYMNILLLTSFLNKFLICIWCA